MLARSVTPPVAVRLESHLAWPLVGPRQSGKTTLARSLSRVYYDREQDQERLRLDLEWDDVLAQKELIVAQCRAIQARVNHVC